MYANGSTCVCNKHVCVCEQLVFQVRPYCYDIIRALQPFFEVVVFTNMKWIVLEQIINHIETVLNKPINEFRQAQ